MDHERGELVSAADGSVRGTQSFVRTLSECWSRPSLTAFEVLWRWTYGVPALVLLWFVGRRVLQQSSLNLAVFDGLTVTRPLDTAQTLTTVMTVLLPAITSQLLWVAPVLMVAWVVWSSVGRTFVLRRAYPELHSRIGTSIVLHFLRAIALAAAFVLWFVYLRWAAATQVAGPLERGLEPNLVSYFALVIVGTLLIFALWSILSWFLSIAPLLAMLRDLGIAKSLSAALRLGEVKGKLIEINLVMGIVKIALLVLAMVFSATPVPFESVATPTFLHVWWTVFTLLYFIASDFFHVARAIAYLKLWGAYQQQSSGRLSADDRDADQAPVRPS
ncbi:MAG TPA: hypothetical protein VFS41_11170 [Edaphobacter sp.]|nr:hypothetical protein [Edaphobacter sp.]